VKLTQSIRAFFLFRNNTIILALLVVSFAVFAGISGLLYPSQYAPLLLLGGLITLAMFIAWLKKPVWAVCATLFLVLFPVGLITASIHSLLNRSLTVIALCVWLVRLLHDRKKIVWTGPTVFMLFFLIWSAVTLFWASKLELATNALQTYSLRFLLFLILIPNVITTKHDLNRLMNTLAFTGWLVLTSFVGTLLLEGVPAGTRLRIFGGNENGVGVIALIGLVGVLWHATQISENPGSARKLAAVIYILLTFGLIAMSGSRGSALSLVVVLISFFFWRALRTWAMVGFVIAVLLLLFTPVIFSTLIERFAVERYDTLLGGREVLWQAAQHLIRDHLLGGVGIGNGPYAVLDYLETNRRIVGAQNVSIHNPILTIWSETGILGIVFYLGILLSAFLSFGRQFLTYSKLSPNFISLYFSLVSSIALGYLVSWFKGGGMESSHSYFLILSMLTLPAGFNIESFGVVPAPGQNLEAEK
jgi:putative inorganic carbon (hco3(-)) transporter